MANALVPILQVAFAKYRLTLGALPPAPAVAVGHTAKTAIAPVDRGRSPGEMIGQVIALLLADRPRADLVIFGVAVAVQRAKRPATKLADPHRFISAAMKHASDFADMGHNGRPAWGVRWQQF